MEKSKEELFLKLGEILAREKQIKETEKRQLQKLIREMEMRGLNKVDEMN